MLVRKTLTSLTFNKDKSKIRDKGLKIKRKKHVKGSYQIK